ncbi:tetratricopeptide repeat protein [Aerosakkonemataceae cyanobacterium BLCC-F50]|uniref:Tetratricopeptide repeat protein n=1 Tax=Floridaenema flaviceps BLCC-F50 TaxID=3153642 RepID=A0ABV4Y1X1_9CYAN
MESYLPVVYLSILLVLLSGAAFAILRQIFKTRKVETSLSRLQNKLKNEKGTAQEYYELGSIYLDKKLFAQSINVFQKALKESENEDAENKALIYNGLGFSYFAQEQYDLAIRQYKEALKLNPQYVTAINNLGHAYEKKKLTAPALQAYEDVLKIEPNNQIAKRRAESLRKRLVTS